jgi:hypothetical protein
MRSEVTTANEYFIFTCVEPIWLRYADVSLERGQGSEVDGPFAQFSRRALGNECS